jgi:alginate O-acetyltransferase complex protein AlgJ
MAHRGFVTLFILISLFPWVDSIFHVDPTVTLQENRTLADFPKFHAGFTAISRYPGLVNDSFNDNFGFRRLMIKTYGLLMLQVFHTPANNAVILGKDHWLFLAGHYGLEYYQTKVPFSDEEMLHRKIVLEQNRSLLQKRGIRFLVVIAPNKDTIYSEYLPDNLVRFRKESRLDQFVQYMGENSDLNILDLRPILIRNKGVALLYDRSDTHWNGNGAYIAYQAILDNIETWYPQVEPLAKEKYLIQSKPGTGDLIGFLGLSDMLSDQIIKITPAASSRASEIRYTLPPLKKSNPPDSLIPRVFQIDDPTLPRLVVFHDSFGIPLTPILAQNFQRSAFFQFDYLSGYENALEILDKEQPNIVIIEMVERSLQWPIFDFSS